MAAADWRWLLVACTIVYIVDAALIKPCSELSNELRHFPCQCELLNSPFKDDYLPEDEKADNVQTGVSITCDEVSFAAEMPALPRGAPIYRYKQVNAGLRSPPPQVFSTGTPLAPLRSVDLTGNYLRRLSGGHLYALRDTLEEVYLAENLLGDTLNPILSTGEFRGLGRLIHLDISRNGIRAVEAGILRGCNELRELVLDGNLLTAVPATELGGPLSLRSLFLRDNLIDELTRGTFAGGQIPQLENLDLSGNGMSKISGGALIGLPQLSQLRLARNRIGRLDSDVFEGTEKLRLVDLTDNYLTEFPGVALTRHAATLTHLDLSANRIRLLENDDFVKLSVLQTLNLSRNEISNLAPGTFLGLRRLRHLDMGVNSLRAIEDDAFEGLDALEKLILTDNNILLVPASALGRLPRMVSLQLDYNRIAAVSGDIVGSVAERAEHLSLARNVIRELPDGTFRRCRRLRKLDLGGNLLAGVPSVAMFTGTDDTLQELLLPYNRLTGLPSGLTFTALHTLDLSNNRLTGFASGALARMPELKFLNLSGNAKLGNGLPADLFGSRPRPLVTVLDFEKTGLRTMPTALLSSTPGIESLYLAGNAITELNERSFVDLRNLTHVDLSNNRITTIRPHTFINAMSIRRLLLSGNRLVSYGGETFNTGTGLEELDLSANRLAYLSPTSFRIHPRLKHLLLSDNRLTYFPAAELITGLQYLELLDLAGNIISAVDELDFSRMPRLRKLCFARNSIEAVGDLAFHNSSQLQMLDLSNNKLSRLGERSLEGLIRLRLLNLSGNQLTELPDTLLDRARIQALDNIDLSYNEFSGAGAPLRTLRRQHFTLTEVNLSHNQLSSVPADDSVLVNVERLDLSYNPLSEEAVHAVLTEPKTVRVLNLASTGLRHIAGRLETPFLRYLNLSHNNITDVANHTFERTSLLETLDFSYNLLKEVGAAGRPPPALHTLFLSDNPIERVSVGDLSFFVSLRRLHISRLPLCIRLERDAFAPLRRLIELEAYGYPRLGYLDIRGLLRNLPSLEQLNIESMDAIFGGSGESITAELHPVRLSEIGVHGTRVTAVAPGALSSLRAPHLTVRLQDTSVTALPPTLFFPVPRSTAITLDVTGSPLTSVPPQLLAAIEDRRDKLHVLGLGTIPLNCDCSARSLRQYLLTANNGENDWSTVLRCATPESLAGVLLSDTPEEQLQCANGKAKRPVSGPSGGIRTTTIPTSTRNAVSSVSSASVTAAAEPDIIWSVEPRPPARSRGSPTSATGPQAAQTPNNDDTLIIGIVGGVVSFIAVLIIGICIVRLRTGVTENRQHHQDHHMSVGGGPGSVYACSVKGAQPLYATYHHPTATMSRSPPNPNAIYQQQPFFVPYPPVPMDDKMSHR